MPIEGLRQAQLLGKFMEACFQANLELWFSRRSKKDAVYLLF